MTFRQIFDEHKTMVYNLALNYVQNREDAEEITQDVFIKIYHKLNHFRLESEFKTWIYRITINQCLDLIKSKKAQKNIPLYNIVRFDHVTAANLSHFDHPGVALEQKEALMTLFQAINKLPDQQKTVLLFLKTENLSQLETAEIMQISVKAVESLFQRAKNNLEKMLVTTKEAEQNIV